MPPSAAGGSGGCARSGGRAGLAGAVRGWGTATSAAAVPSTSGAAVVATSAAASSGRATEASAPGARSSDGSAPDARTREVSAPDASGPRTASVSRTSVF